MRQIKKIGLLAVGDSAWRGGIQYIVNIIYALNESPDHNDLEIHLFKRNSQHFPELADFKRVNIVVHPVDDVLPPFSFANRVVWFLQRKFFKRINPRMENYFLSNKFDYVFPAILSSCGGKLNAAAWIADFQYHHFPDGHNRETNIQAERTIEYIATHAEKIILSSKFCEADSYQLFPQTRGKSHVMPFSVYINNDHLSDDLLKVVRLTYGINEPFIMVSNLFAATKNHKTLFEALGILRKQGVKISCVCTGNFVNYAQMEFTNEVLQMITENGIRDQLYILGLIPREHQVALYRLSMAMVQPSINEGWSTCVEEAKALGKTLLLSDIDVHKEQYPDNPFFFKALNPSDLAAKIKEVTGLLQEKEFPDMEIEKEALTNYSRNIKSFGENFLAIASLK